MTLGFFPSPYPDETLYSLYARYAARVRYPSRLALIRNLTGSVNPIEISGFPSRLNHLIASLPFGHCFSLEMLIQNHTLFPLYATFWPLARRVRVQAAMAGTAHNLKTLAGISAARIRPPAFLQFCPACAKEDDAQYGEPYWHRLHQVAGVLICPKHKVWLQQSCVEGETAGRWTDLVPAYKAIDSRTKRVQIWEGLDRQHLIAIADDVAWLLKAKDNGQEPSLMQSRYWGCLLERGFATWSGRMHREAVVHSMAAHYSPKLLMILQCPLTPIHRTTWVVRIFHQTRIAHAHPIEHLLVMHWLGHRVEGFLQLPDAQAPFGDGPWPCLNPARPHGTNTLIKKVTFGKPYRGRPVGIFGCVVCGFTYARVGPDTTAQRASQLGKIVLWGKWWEGRLKDLWFNAHVPLKLIQKHLGVSFQTIRRQAIRLRLPQYRLGCRRKWQDAATPREDKRTEGIDIEAYKHLWLEVRRHLPDLGRTELAHRFSRLKSFLYRHDREWLENHQPRRKTRGGWKAKIDWDARDRVLAAQVNAVIKRLKQDGSMNGKCRSIHAVRSRLSLRGRHCLSRRNEENLPKTFRTLNKYLNG